MTVTYERGPLNEMRAFYRTMGDVSRLRIVHVLASEGELPISDIAGRLKLSPPLLSWHLRRLQRLGLVRMTRVGREVRCTFDRERFAQLNERGLRTLMNPSSFR
jgi:ArsR family transcriptional regulator